MNGNASEGQNAPEYASHTEDLPNVLRGLLDKPHRISAVSIGTIIASSAPTFRFRTSAETVDPQALAERMMLDATTWVSVLEQGRLKLPKQQDVQSERHVPINAVLRGGALSVGLFAFFCGLGSVLGGVTLLHPLLAVLLITASIGFYAISFAPLP